MVTTRALAEEVVTASAHADEAPTASAEPRRARTVAWDPAWPKFRPVEWAASLAAGAGVFAIRTFVEDPEARFHGGVLFDDAIADALRGDDGEARETAQNWSNVLYHGGAIIGVVEAPLTALAVHRNPEVAWQLSLMNAEAFALAGLVQLAGNRLVARERPFVEHCRETGETDFPCGNGGSSLSFSSGHVLTLFVAAGLNCAHHSELPLWGNPIADGAACAIGIAAGTTNGALRIMADKHWATDVLYGALVGFGFGYGVPKLLHYRSTRAKLEKHARSSGPTFLAPVPWVAADRLGLSFGGAF